MSLSTRVVNALPHDAARGAYRVLRPQKYAKLMSLRERISQSPKEPSLLPFIELRCIFVHIPKCAGLGVTTSLFHGVHPGRHYTISHYRLAFSKQEFDSFFKFTFVRNPWDRLVSAYFYLRDGGRTEGDRAIAEAIVKPYPSFRDFVLQFVTEKNVSDTVHFKPQYQYVCMTNRDLPQVDFIGRFERLEEDFEHVRKRLGLSEPLASQNRGRSRPDRYRASYDQEMIDRVARVYRRDIELFGYSF
jgi:hypothetical protein